MRFWCGNSSLRGTSLTKWCMLREMLIHIFTCGFIGWVRYFFGNRVFLLGSAKKLLKKERFTKMKNIYIIVISVTRSNWIWHFTAPHHVTCVTLSWNYSHMICVTVRNEWTLVLCIFIYNLWNSQLQTKFYIYIVKL